jgi:hypothetical protein
MLLGSRSANAEHLARQLKTAVPGLSPGDGEALARTLANVLADLDHRLRVEVDEALGRMEARVDEQLRELAEAEQ